MMVQPRLALIGSGPIADFHVTAAKKAGFQVTAVAGRPGSSRAPVFAETHDIPEVWSDPAELARSADWDALILAVTPEATLDLLSVAAEQGKPVLVEKPVALESEALKPYRSAWPHVLVAYNRRHYAPVRRAREFVESHDRCLVHMQLPESVPPADQTVAEREFAVRTNSVHGFDLLRYLLGDLTVESVVSLGDPMSYLGRTLTLVSDRGDVCTVTANWNAPANFSVDISAGVERFQLLPFEMGHVFKGMNVIDPTPDIPIRRYMPLCVETVPPDELSVRFKPGFVKQASALMGLRDGEPVTREVATMSDAYEALRLAETVLKGSID